MNGFKGSCFYVTRQPVCVRIFGYAVGFSFFGELVLVSEAGIFPECCMCKILGGPNWVYVF
jgi:hypothetical protein